MGAQSERRQGFGWKTLAGVAFVSFLTGRRASHDPSNEDAAQNWNNDDVMVEADAMAEEAGAGTEPDRRSQALIEQNVRTELAPAAEPQAEPDADPVLVAPATAAVYYQNCSHARAMGAAPVYRGDPGYARKLDRDGDGVGCEN